MSARRPFFFSLTAGRPLYGLHLGHSRCTPGPPAVCGMLAQRCSLRLWDSRPTILGGPGFLLRDPGNFVYSEDGVAWAKQGS